MMAAEGQEEPMVFHAGDRVVVDGLANATHLNGRHGCVAKPVNDRDGYAVDLDLDPTQHRVTVRPTNLTREPLIPPEIEAERADVEQGGGGILVESHGRAINFVLEASRYIAADYFLSDPEIQSIDDVCRLRTEGGQRGLLKQQYLTATAWSNWSSDERGGGRKPAEANLGRQTMYQCLVQYLQEDLPRANREAGVELPPDIILAGRSLDLPHAAGGWHLRVHGEFWVVGMDEENDTGTYLVSTKNLGLVYKVLGVRSPLYPMVAQNFGDTPVVFTVTMVPWFGRLVYDGTVAPAGGGLFGPTIATASEARTLKEAVRSAEEEGRVIERLCELEVPGGTRVPADTPVTAATSNEQSGEDFTPDEEEQPPATTEEERLVDRFRRVVTYDPEDNHGYWVYRRMGYTELENPEHMGLVMQGSGSVLGPFECSALDPTPLDILKSLAEECDGQDRRPTMLMLDGRTSYERIKFLLKDVEGTCVEYYRPPSREEEAAATMMPPGSIYNT